MRGALDELRELEREGGTCAPAATRLSDRTCRQQHSEIFSRAPCVYPPGKCATHLLKRTPRSVIESRAHAPTRLAGNKLEWKSPLTMDDMVRYPDPRLRRPNDTIATFGDDLKRLANEMFDVMYQCASRLAAC